MWKRIGVAFLLGLAVGAIGLWLWTRPVYDELQRIDDRADFYQRRFEDASDRLEETQRRAAEQLGAARVALEASRNDNRRLRKQLESDGAAVGGVGDTADDIEEIGGRLDRIIERLQGGSDPAAPE